MGEKLSIHVLRQLISYDPLTGLLTWKRRARRLFKTERAWAVWNARYAGKAAFTCIDKNGYCKGSIFDRNYYAHQIAWALKTGKWPKRQIDHENHKRSHNSFGNLNPATNAQNAKNKKKSAFNTSGITGVFFHKKTQKYRARIEVKGKSIHLGCFPKIEGAAMARKKAEIKHGFHPNHGAA